MGLFLFTCTKCGANFPGAKSEWQKHTRECTGRTAKALPTPKPVKPIEKVSQGKLKPKGKTAAEHLATAKAEALKSSKTMAPVRIPVII